MNNFFWQYTNHSLDFTNLKNIVGTYQYYIKLLLKNVSFISLNCFFLNLGSLGWVPRNGSFGSKIWFLGFQRTHMKKGYSRQREKAISFLHEPSFNWLLQGAPGGSWGFQGVPRLENFAILNFTVSLGSELTAKLKKWLYCFSFTNLPTLQSPAMF